MPSEDAASDQSHEIVIRVRGRAACDRMRQVLAEPDFARASFDQSTKQMELLSQGVGQLIEHVGTLTTSMRSIQDKFAELQAAPRANGHYREDEDPTDWADHPERNVKTVHSAEDEVDAPAAAERIEIRETVRSPEPPPGNAATSPKNGWLRRWPLHLLATGILLCSGAAYWVFRA